MFMISHLHLFDFIFFFERFILHCTYGVWCVQGRSLGLEDRLREREGEGRKQRNEGLYTALCVFLFKISLFFTYKKVMTAGVRKLGSIDHNYIESSGFHLSGFLDIQTPISGDRQLYHLHQRVLLTWTIRNPDVFQRADSKRVSGAGSGVACLSHVLCFTVVEGFSFILTPYHTLDMFSIVPEGFGS